MNRVELTGKLGRDAEVRWTPNGKCICTLSVCTSDRKKTDSGEWKDENVEWHKVKVIGSLAEKAGTLHKGDSVFIDGRIHYDSWEKDGVKNYSTEIVTFHIAPLAKFGEVAQQPAPTPQEPFPKVEDEDPDLPF